MGLYQHQNNILLENPSKHLFCWGTGTGKTRAAIEVANQNCDAVLIITPKSNLIREAWKLNLFKYAKFTYMLVTKEEFRRDWKKLPGFQGVIIDESHYFFGMGSQMSAALHKYFEKWNTEYRWFLTATPFLSTPWNIFMALKLYGMEPNYIKFRSKFFYKIRMGAREMYVPRKGMEEEIKELILKIGSIVKLDECADVPEQTFEAEFFSLTNSQKSGIESIIDINHIVRWTKTHQICGGTCKGNEYEESKYYECEKIERVKELAEEFQRMIIVCRYRHEMDHLAFVLESLSIKVGMIHGNVKNKQKVIESLGERYVLIVNAACSEGWELPSCSVMVFYSYDFALKNYVQMIGRLNRINNLKKNLYLSLVIKKTIDEDVYNAVQRKEDFHLSLYKKEQP